MNFPTWRRSRWFAGESRYAIGGVITRKLYLLRESEHVGSETGAREIEHLFVCVGRTLVNQGAQTFEHGGEAVHRHGVHGDFHGISFR